MKKQYKSPDFDFKSFGPVLSFVLKDGMGMCKVTYL